MRFLLVLAVVLLASCATQQPTPKKSLRVVGQGPTLDIAKQNAFREAIEISVGTLVIADRNIQNSKVIRDDIGRHSSGYIDNYKIVGKIDSDQVTVIMDVTVSESKIYERMLGGQSKSDIIEGQRLFTQIATYKQSKESGKKIVSTVMREYPRNAFNVISPDTSCGDSKAKYCLKLNSDGTALVEIPFEVTWNYNFLTALNEVLAYVSDSSGSEKFTLISKRPGSIVGNKQNYWFIDKNQLLDIKNKFVGYVYVKGSILDNQNNVLFSSCKLFFQVPHVDYSGFLLDGNEKFWDSIYVNVNNSDRLMNATKIDVTIVNRNC